jgi:hypothetical protein
MNTTTESEKNASAPEVLQPETFHLGVPRERRESPAWDQFESRLAPTNIKES